MNKKYHENGLSLPGGQSLPFGDTLGRTQLGRLTRGSLRYH